MSLQPLPPPQTARLQVSGQVTIDPSAAIAPGVILRAAPNSKIIIAGGACVGMGVILNAYNGIIEIGAGANLAPGVLMVGAGKIGENACIGGITTIFNASVPAMQVVPAGSVLGDHSRTVEVLEDLPLADPWESEATEATEIATASEVEPTSPNNAEATAFKAQVSGRVHVDRLLLTLFPQKQSLDNHSANSE
ncbi:MAG: hypothetical protein SAJ12_15450 [Jaaginema sp. PMC 1079.18]|nr:hypothetical protein [Jaaginema sp. PMC 1080.18]MEC4852379.1 hypothetical protein [Jaaginema sp. PMC 1079.18]MEC4866657.1 hypothetical protein [Jaaginema sp. PMC 1078.18]